MGMILTIQIVREIGLNQEKVPMEKKTATEKSSAYFPINWDSQFMFFTESVTNKVSLTSEWSLGTEAWNVKILKCGTSAADNFK